MKFSFSAIALVTSALAAVVPTTTALGLTDEGDVRVNPDPHFTMFDGLHYDYHGGCDLVLITNPLLDLHIRTFPVTGYSYISRAAVRIGGDTLEVLEDGTYLVNGGPPLSTPATIGGYPFTVSVTPYVKYEVELPDGQFVSFGSYGSSLNVHVHGSGSHFGDSTGMGGTWSTPGFIERDGSTISTDAMVFATEWQVMPSDPLLFSEAAVAGGTHPDACLPPNAFPGCVARDQGGGCDTDICKECLTDDQVKAACADIDDDQCILDCQFDVMMTGDVETWPKAPFYQTVEECPATDQCADRGGLCVSDCDASCYSSICEPTLCRKLLQKDEQEQGLRRATLLTKPIKAKCTCKIPTKAGLYHNALIDLFREQLPENADTDDFSIESERHDDVLELAGDLLIDEFGTDVVGTKAIVGELKGLTCNPVLRHICPATGTEYVHYNDLTSLLHLLKYVPECNAISLELEEALYSVYYEAQFQERVCGEGDVDLNALLFKFIFTKFWEGNDKDFVVIFHDVYEASLAYWEFKMPDEQGTRSLETTQRQLRRRPPRWVTILADAVGGAIGGAAGAAAGGIFGPGGAAVGAGIGAGIMGAAASGVFSGGFN